MPLVTFTINFSLFRNVMHDICILFIDTHNSIIVMIQMKLVHSVVRFPYLLYFIFKVFFFSQKSNTMDVLSRQILQYLRTKQYEPRPPVLRRKDTLSSHQMLECIDFKEDCFIDYHAKNSNTRVSVKTTGNFHSFIFL